MYEQNETLKKYIEACEVLGLETAVACTRNPLFAKELISIAKSIGDVAERKEKWKTLVDKIPRRRQRAIAIPYIRSFSQNQKDRALLKSLLSYQDRTIAGMKESALFANEEDYGTIQAFFEFCAFDKFEQIEWVLNQIREHFDLFEPSSYSNELRSIFSLLIVELQMETKKHTRFSEKEMKAFFGVYYENIKTLLRGNLYGITFNPYLKVYLLESDTLFYKKEAIENFADSLPNCTHIKGIATIIEEGKKQLGIPNALMKNFVSNVYQKLGDIYCKPEHFKMTEIVPVAIDLYFPNGFCVRKQKEELIGLIRNNCKGMEVKLTEATLEYIVYTTCIACNKGIYRAKKEKYLSDELLNKIRQFISNHSEQEIPFECLYDAFKEELIDENITSRLFLKPVIKDEICKDEYTWTHGLLLKPSKEMEAQS